MSAKIYSEQVDPVLDEALDTFARDVIKIYLSNGFSDNRWAINKIQKMIEERFDVYTKTVIEVKHE